MKPTPTPQLITIPVPALVPTNPLPPGAIPQDGYSRISQSIDIPDRSESLWEEFLRLQLKPRTRQEYAKAIDYFCRSMAPEKSPALFLQEFLKLPERPAILLVLEWQQQLLDEGKASATINQRIAALKSLVAYAGKNGACGFSLSDIRSLKRQPYKDTRGVALQDYRSILAKVDRCTDLGIRDYAILRLLWDLALRREEVVSLDIWHYLPGKLMILGKGKVDRQGLDTSEGLAEPLDNWVAIRNGLYFQPKNGERSDFILAGIDDIAIGINAKARFPLFFIVTNIDCPYFIRPSIRCSHTITITIDPSEIYPAPIKSALVVKRGTKFSTINGRAAGQQRMSPSWPPVVG